MVKSLLDTYYLKKKKEKRKKNNGWAQRDFPRMGQAWIITLVGKLKHFQARYQGFLPLCIIMYSVGDLGTMIMVLVK